MKLNQLMSRLQILNKMCLQLNCLHLSSCLETAALSPEHADHF